MDSNPMVFELNDVWVPTVYLVWNYPMMLPLLFTNQLVISKLFNGADLMVPGILKFEINQETKMSSTSFDRDAIVGICVIGSMHPVVIGKALLSSDELLSVNQGKAVLNLHFVGDSLWSVGDKSDPPTSTPAVLESKEDESNLSLDMSEVKITEESPLSPTVNAEEMEKYFDYAFLSSLHVSITDKMLPLSASALYSGHMVLFKPSDIVLDIRKTSFKKLSKFMKNMEKKGIIQTKERSGELFIVTINRKHPLYEAFSAPKKPKPSTTAKEQKKSEPNSVMTVNQLFKLPHNGPLLKFVVESKINHEEYWTSDQVNLMLLSYFKSQALIHLERPRLIKIDALLCDCILTKSEYQTVDFLERDVIQKRFLSKMVPYHQLTLPNGESIIKKGALVPIEISVKRKIGNKWVSIIKNLEQFEIDAYKIADILKIKCAGSTTVSERVDTKLKTLQVTVQGSKVKEICQVLETFGIPKLTLNGKVQLQSNLFVQTIG
ncbi:hypothetical protein BC833DRAFT_585540 [Globomyces pollinis-pini]|nr:hypothetical protein BC833DRAFT_585540 [Globomyces pollinis-pini]